MTLPTSGYHARVVALGSMDKRNGVSSQANLVIFVKVLLGNIFTSGHKARAMSLNKFLREKAIKKIKNNKTRPG
jgi:hypothetical protein